MYYRDKLRYQVDSTIRQLCKEQPETVAHILAGCPALAQHHYTARHNAGLKCLYFTLLKHYELVNKIPPWHLAIEPKPEVKNDQVTHTQTETDRHTDKERQTKRDRQRETDRDGPPGTSYTTQRQTELVGRRVIVHICHLEKERNREGQKQTKRRF